MNETRRRGRDQREAHQAAGAEPDVRPVHAAGARLTGARADFGVSTTTTSGALYVPRPLAKSTVSGVAQVLRRLRLLRRRHRLVEAARGDGAAAVGGLEVAAAGCPLAGNDGTGGRASRRPLGRRRRRWRERRRRCG